LVLQDGAVDEVVVGVVEEGVGGVGFEEGER
jgi:hypothetical protein